MQEKVIAVQASFTSFEGIASNLVWGILRGKELDLKTRSFHSCCRSKNIFGLNQKISLRQKFQLQPEISLELQRVSKMRCNTLILTEPPSPSPPLPSPPPPPPLPLPSPPPPLIQKSWFLYTFLKKMLNLDGLYFNQISGTSDRRLRKRWRTRGGLTFM